VEEFVLPPGALFALTPPKICGKIAIVGPVSEEPASKNETHEVTRWMGLKSTYSRGTFPRSASPTSVNRNWNGSLMKEIISDFGTSWMKTVSFLESAAETSLLDRQESRFAIAKIASSSEPLNAAWR
jgi:hypothetical protein